MDEKEKNNNHIDGRDERAFCELQADKIFKIDVSLSAFSRRHWSVANIGTYKFPVEYVCFGHFADFSLNGTFSETHTKRTRAYNIKIEFDKCRMAHEANSEHLQV